LRQRADQSRSEPSPRPEHKQWAYWTKRNSLISCLGAVHSIVAIWKHAIRQIRGLVAICIAQWSQSLFFRVMKEKHCIQKSRCCHLPSSLTNHREIRDSSAVCLVERCGSLIFKDNKEQNIDVRRSLTVQWPDSIQNGILLFLSEINEVHRSRVLCARRSSALNFVRETNHDKNTRL
jgi:hypothetical protein